MVGALNLFIANNKQDSARTYLSRIIDTVIFSKENGDFMPDEKNSIKNVIKYTVTGMKPVYYSDKTSPLISVLLEFAAVLEMEDEYLKLREFVKNYDIELGVFVPFHGKESTSIHLSKDKDNDLEEQMFSRSVNDGYQSQLRLTKNFSDPLDFEDFKEKIKLRKFEFQYDYRTSEAGYPFLLDLAHIYFLTPFFPDRWRVNFN